MKLLWWIYSAYALIIFAILFLILFPFLIFPIINRKKFNWVGRINRIWARMFFFLIAFQYEIDYEEKLDPGKCYVVCPNHFSYLDIPTIGLISVDAIFIGKTAMQNVPFFGWMYERLHITVNRNNLRSKFNTYIRGSNAIEEGNSLVVFPEGGIVSNKIPELAKFKTGPFRIAIENQVPIVPVSIYNNWEIQPDVALSSWKRIKMKIHKKIDTDGLSLSDLHSLKEKVYRIIAEDLKKYHENN